MALPNTLRTPKELTQSSLETFSGARNVHFNDLTVTQINQSSSHVSELFQLLDPIPDASHKRNRRLAPPNSQCMDGTREGVLGDLRAWANEPCSIPNVTQLPQPTPETSAKPKRSRLWGSVKKLLSPSSPRTPRVDNTAHPGPPEPDIPTSINVIVQHICWMYGHVGCGKSAIAQAVAEELAGNGKLAASFFFFRNAGDRSNMDRLAGTLAHQISQNVPGTKSFIESTLREDRGLLGRTRSLESQLEDLVFQPCLKALGTGDPPIDGSAYVIVIDGLDECDDKEGVRTLIKYAITFFTRHPTIPLRLFITSRIEEHIRSLLVDAAPRIHLLDLNSKFRREDLALYMRVAFSNAIKHNRALQTQAGTWPEEKDLDKLIDYCDGSFIIGSTLVKFILGDLDDNDPRTPMERLPLALDINHGLDGVYDQILSRSKHLPHFHLIISALAVVQQPLSISALSALLYLSTFEVVRVLVNLQAVINVPGGDDVPVTFFHTSLRDFLIEESRSGDKFYVPPSRHTFFMERCLNLLFGPHPSYDEECSRYAMLYWAKHWEYALKMDPSFDYPQFETLEHFLGGEHQHPGSVSTQEESQPLAIYLHEGWFHQLKANVLRAYAQFHQTWEIFPTWPTKHGDHSPDVCPLGWHESRTSEGARNNNKLESLTPCSSIMLLEGIVFILRHEGTGLSNTGLDPLLQLVIPRGAGGCINLIFDRTALEGFNPDAKFEDRLGVMIFIIKDIPPVALPADAPPSASE